jgi:transposase
MFYYSRDRKGEHPQGHLARDAGILRPTSMTGTTSFAWLGAGLDPPGGGLLGPCAASVLRHADIEENARRKTVGKKEIPLSPIAVEVVRRIDALFEIERSINGRSPEECFRCGRR